MLIPTAPSAMRWADGVFGEVSTVLGISLLIAWTTASTYFAGMAIGVTSSFGGAGAAGICQRYSQLAGGANQNSMTEWSSR